MRPSLIVKIDSIHDMNNVVSDALHKFSDTKEEFLYNYIDKNRNVKLEELTLLVKLIFIEDGLKRKDH